MTIVWIWRHPQELSYLLSNNDGHFALFGYSARYYDIHLVVPSHFDGDVSRDNYVIHGRTQFSSCLDVVQQLNPDAVVCYGPFGEQEWPQVRLRAPQAVFCLDYAGGPLCDLDGKAPGTAGLFDFVFTAHETQAQWLRDLGVRARKSRGVDCEVYKPMPMKKLWRAIYPANFSPGKRNPLVAQYLEQYKPKKPSLFLGNFENFSIVEMTACGGIPLNKPGIPQRNGIEMSPRCGHPVMPLLYNASEVCIVGSQEEAGPWIALESMACGVPAIIMGDCEWGVADAFRELERDFGGCRVVDPLPDAIHVGVESLLSDYRHESQNARTAIVARYDWFPHFYDVVDRCLKNAVGLKQAGQGLDAA